MLMGNIQYASDTLLIEKLFLIDAGLRKQAGVLDLLGGIGASIQEWAKQHIDTSSVTGILTSLADLMVPGILFKINPMLGGLAIGAQVLGFSPSMIVKKILTYLRPKLESGESISLDEINSVGKSAVAEEAGAIEATASNDMFWAIREIEKRGELVRFVKQAQMSDELKSMFGLGKPAPTTPNIPFFGGGSPSVIERVFGQLFKTRQTGKARWLLGGFVVWIIKTVLLGAGLIAAGEKIKSLFHGHDSKPVVSLDSPKENNSGAAYTPQESDPIEHSQQESPGKLTATGYGQEQHVNDSKISTWYVPVIGGTVESTLIAWAGYVYNELKGKASLIVSNPSFNRAVQEMRSNFEPGAAHIQVPSKFKSIKQVVDIFAHDVAAKL